MKVNFNIGELNIKIAKEIATSLNLSVPQVRKLYKSGMQKILYYYTLHDDKREELAFLLFRLTTTHYLQNEKEE